MKNNLFRANNLESLVGSNKLNYRLFILLLATLGIFTFSRIFFLFNTDLNLFYDEAQYWIWSKYLSFGYYSKPPMVSWLIYLTSNICGDAEPCIKLSSSIVHFITAIVIFFIGKKLYTPQIGFLSAISYITSPGVSFSSLIISTDPALICFAALTLLSFIYALERNTISSWLLVGLFGGLGMLTKYSMSILAFSVFGYLISSNKYKFTFRNYKIYLAALTGLLIFLPNIIWNYQHYFVTFSHTKDNANLQGSLFHLKHLGEFFLAQFAVFGPILFFCLIFLVTFANYKKKALSERTLLLTWFITPTLLLMLILSLLSRAHANWAATISVPATIMVIAYLVNRKYFIILTASIMLNLLAATVILFANPIIKEFGFQFTPNKTNLSIKSIRDPLLRIRGWRDLGNEVSKIIKLYPNAILITDSRKLYSELVYYVTPRPFSALKWNPNHEIKDHFDLTASLDNADNNLEFIFVTNTVYPYEKLNKCFSSVIKLDNIVIEAQSSNENKYNIYRLGKYLCKE